MFHRTKLMRFLTHGSPVLLTGGLFVVGLLAPVAALAAPGDHIGGEEASLIPAVEVGATHRTNVYQQEGESSGGVPVTAGTSLFLTPSLGLRARLTELHADLDFSYTARKYLQEDVQNLDRFNMFDINGGLKLFPSGKVGLRLKDHFAITGYEAEDEAKILEDAYQQHLTNDFAAFLSIHPGGPLEVDLGGRVVIDQWNVPEETKPLEDAPDLDVLSSLSGPALNNRLGYGPLVQAKWRFFPKTAIVGDFGYEWFNWTDNILDAQGDGISREEVGDYLAIPDGRLWRARAGLRGRVTEKVVVGAIVGFGQALYDEDSVTEAGDALGIGGSSELDPSVGFGDDLKDFPNGLLAEADVEYAFVPDHKLVVAYKRDFQDVYFTNYVGYDRASLGYQGRFADVIGVDLSGAYRLERYGGEVARDDHLLRLGLVGTWYVQDYLSVNVGGGWNRRASADGLHPEIEYDDAKFQAGVKFVY